MSTPPRWGRQLPESEPATEPAAAHNAFLAAVPDPSESVPLRQVLTAVRRHLLLILGTTVLVVGAATYFALQDPRVYRASAVVRLTDTRRVMTGETDGIEAVIGESADPLLSLLQLLRSRGVIGAVVDSVGLQLAPASMGASVHLLQQFQMDSAAVGDTLRLRFGPDTVQAQNRLHELSLPYGSLVDLETIRFVVPERPPLERAVFNLLPRSMAIDRVLIDLDVEQRQETDVVDVSYTDPDPVLAQRVVNTLVHVFQQTRVSTAQDESRRRRLFLAEQLHVTDSLLGIAQDALSVFRSRAQLASARDKLDAEQVALGTVRTELEEMNANRRVIDASLGQLQSGDAGQRIGALTGLAAVSEMATDPVIPRLQAQLLSDELMLDSLTTGPWRRAESNPDVVRLRSLLDARRRQLVGAVRGRLAALDARIGALNSQLARSGSAIRTLPAMEASEARLDQRVTTLSSLADVLRQKYEEARMAEVVEAGDVEIVDLAALPYVAIWPTGAFKLLLGLILGLLLGTGLAIAREGMNTSIRRPEEVEQLLHIPELAVIPRISVSGRMPVYGVLSDWRRRGERTTRSLAPLVTLSRTPSLCGEAFRMLRTSLLWSEWGQQLRTIVVTSVSANEGKTFTAANLAIALASDGLRVLLIDSDLRQPQLHRLFGVTREPGLAELLETVGSSPDPGGPVDADKFPTLGPVATAAVAASVRRTAVKTLFLISAGTSSRGSSDLLSGTSIRAVLHTLAGQYDFVLIDTPPVLAVADAGVVAALADGVLLVIRAGHTERAAAQRAYQQLGNLGARVVGAVLNDPGGEVARYGGHYYPYAYPVAASS